MVGMPRNPSACVCVLYVGLDFSLLLWGQNFPIWVLMVGIKIYILTSKEVPWFFRSAVILQFPWTSVFWIHWYFYICWSSHPHYTHKEDEMHSSTHTLMVYFCIPNWVQWKSVIRLKLCDIAFGILSGWALSHVLRMVSRSHLSLVFWVQEVTVLLFDSQKEPRWYYTLISYNQDHIVY